MALKSLLFVSLLTLTSLFADTSSTDAEFRGEAKAKITFLEKQNTELKAKLDSLEDKQKSVEEYKAIIDRQDKRVEDVNAKMAWAAEKTSWLAVIVGVLTLFAGFVGFMTYRQNEKAKEEAKKDIEFWKEKTKHDFKIQFEEELINLKKHTHKVKSEVNEDKEKIKQILADIDLASIEKRKNFTPEEQELARKESRIIAKEVYKEELDDDIVSTKYIESAKLAYVMKNYGDAIINIDKALMLIKNENIKAKTLLLKGIILNDQNEKEKAIQVFDEFLDKFENSQNIGLEESIATALFNKAFILGENKEHEESIQIYSILLDRFKYNPNEAIQLKIALSLYNIGFNYGKMNQHHKAFKIYNELLQLFQKNQQKAIQEIIHKVFVSITEIELVQNEEWKADEFESYLECVKSNKQSLLLLKMLQTIHNALQEDQTYSIEQLKQELLGTNFGNWSWKELDTWAEKLEDEEAKKRVQQTIEIFKNWDKKA